MKPSFNRSERVFLQARYARLDEKVSMIKVINLEDKFKKFDELWSPKIISGVDDYDVKIVKVKGELVWHDHKDEDELFYIIKGKFKIELEEGIIEIDPGELVVIPKGKKHRPFADEETWMMVLESSKIKHTGDVVTEKTLKEFEEI